MLSGTGVRVLQVFVANLTKRFSIRKVALLLNKPYALIHKTVSKLLSRGFLAKDENDLVFLNYKENIQELAYVESMRTKEFLEKNPTIKLFTSDILEKIDCLIFLVFGSYVKKRQTRRSDIDVLIIVGEEERVDKVEKIARNISTRFSTKIDCNVISKQSVYEMLGKRDEKNVMNEVLDNHIILFGAENYYKMIKDAR